MQDLYLEKMENSDELKEKLNGDIIFNIHETERLNIFKMSIILT